MNNYPLSPREVGALAEDAAPIHNGGNLLKQSTMSTGNVQQTIDAADYQVQGHYQHPWLFNIVTWKRNIAGVDGG
ncbi:hypothetical protein ACLBOM_09560 [Escherichia coli]